MSDYRPICDTWLLARPKVDYYGAFPSGFLERARALLGVGLRDPVLHVCAGRVRDYPFAGLGPNDKTLDLDPATAPDFCADAARVGMAPCEGGRQEAFPSAAGTWVSPQGCWAGVLVDRPYTPEDAAHYAPGSAALPDLNDLLRRCLQVVVPGGRVGVLDYLLPRPPREGAKFVACVHVLMGYGNRSRAYSVFERDATTPEQRQRALDAVRGKKPRHSQVPRGAVLPEDLQGAAAAGAEENPFA